ncbi:MAG: hypothetical protein Q8P48_07820, partial [Deltaproteobacteria bacterium]|nr:hypothetical protein [Deltaproteobacteria bacterium]
MNNKAVYAAAFSIALITFLAYLPSLQNGFVNWDDLDYVYENELIRSIDLNFIKTILTTPLVYNWHPLTMFSYAVDYSLWGLDPLGYHLVNIVIHSIDTALVFLLALRLACIAGEERGESEGTSTGRLAAALVAAALFGLHPLHVESVSWISERKDGLCAFFFLSSALMYLKYAGATPGKGRYYACSLLLFIPALMSKSMAVTLPAVLLILDFYPLRRRLTPKLLYEKAPFFLLSLLVSALTIWAQREGGALVGINAYPAPWRAVIALRAHAFYIYKMLAPINLAP